MKTFSLDGNWQLFMCPGGSQAPRSPTELFASSPQPIRAVVPGNVEIDLHQNGLIPDLFTSDGIHHIRQYETCDFWYARKFDLPHDFSLQPIELFCAGLDTLASIWINGIYIGESENMLIEHKFLVTHALLPGKTNEIVIRLASVMEKARKYPMM